eukprot:15482521-Alexandrium_andersonii.AAC.1
MGQPGHLQHMFLGKKQKICLHNPFAEMESRCLLCCPWFLATNGTSGSLHESRINRKDRCTSASAHPWT